MAFNDIIRSLGAGEAARASGRAASPLRRLPEVPPSALAAVAAVGLGAAVLLLLLGLPVAWLLLAICALATLPIVVWAVIERRFFEPLPIVATAGALLFVARPLQLYLNWRDLYSFFPPPRGARSLVLLENQEIAYYVTSRLTEPLQAVFTRATGACALFLVAVVAGYCLPIGERLARPLSRLRAGVSSGGVRAAVAASLIIGTAAEVVIVRRAGGPGESLKSAQKQVTLSEGFALYLLSGFAVAGILVWAAWHRPTSRREWAAFWLSVAAVCAFSIIAGSRERVFVPLVMLAIVKHYLWRPWRLRELVVGALVFLVFVSGYVAFRQGAERQSLGRAIKDAPQYVLDGRVVLNDISSYDFVIYATETFGRSRPTTIAGRTRPYKYGGWFSAAVRSYIPRAIYPGKPQGGDIELRKVVWGSSYKAGRPPTAVGDLYIDFGFPGIAIGALLLGILGRGLLGLLRGGGDGRPYRIAVYALALIVIYEFVVNTYSIALGYALTFGLPFLVAVHGVGRLAGRAARTRAHAGG